MVDLIACAAVVWCVAIIIGIVMIEYRLNKIQRVLETRERREQARGYL
jgi:hypothetical protein